MSTDTASFVPESDADVSQPQPLTPAQQGIWLAAQKLGDPAAYAVAESTRLTGRLDISAWADAANEVLRDVPALRMRLRPPAETWESGAGDGIPRATFDAPAARAMIVDLRAEGDPDAAAERWISRASSEPLPPQNGVVSHAALLRTGDEEARWFLRVHHVAADGYAFALIGRELSRAYARRLRGETPSVTADATALDALLTALAEQRLPADRSLAEEHRRYWLEAAPTADPVSLTNEGDPMRPVRTGINAPVTVHRDPVALITGLALLSGALSRRSEAVVGVHVMNRASRPLLRAVCTAQSVLPLRIPLDPALTLGELLDRVEMIWEEARTHQAHRHESLRQDWALAPEVPLYDVALNLVPFAHSMRFGDAAGRAEVVWEGPAEGLCLDVRAGLDGQGTLAIVSPEGGLAAPALAGTAEVLRALLHTVGRARDEDAETRDLARGALLRDLELVGARDPGLRDDAVLQLASRTPVSTGFPTWAIGALDREVRSADAAGLVAPDRTLSRADCAAAANRLARLLRRRGVGAADRVALLLPRSSWAVLAPVAVLQCGAAFVPCDTAWPGGRVFDVVAAARPALLVVSGMHDLDLAAIDVPVLDLDDPAVQDELAALPGEALGDEERTRPVAPDDAAYVLFTSGSTGVPKGVVVEHRQLGNLARTAAELLLPAERTAAGLDDDEVLTCVHEHSFAFDSGLSPLVAFLHGHRLLVPAYEELRVPTSHLAYLRAHRPDVLDISPAVLEELLHLGFVPGERADDGKRIVTSVLIGGDACSDALWAQLRGVAATGVLAINAYGPTENTVDSTMAWIGAHASPSIGRALPRQRADVCDAWGRVLPVGVVGELRVSGDSVARGYLDDEAATAARFVDGPRGRAYRTGDLVRREPDGSLTFLGRADTQISLRGVRIEPAEVEAALLHLSGVRQAVVVVRDGGTGARLIGYVVHDGAFDARQARERLRERLPSAFVPSTIVALDALPLTDRGKIDRRLLPVPESTAGEGGSWDELGESERVVAGLLGELLGIEPTELRRGSDLFALGGHSLTAARLLGRLGEAGFHGVRLRDLFADPSIGGIAALVDDETTAIPDGGPPATASGFAGAFPLTDAQRRLWVIEQAQGPSALYSIPVVLRVRGRLDIDALGAALADAVHEHLTLQCTYPDAGDGSPAPIRSSAAEIGRATAPRLIDADPADPRLAALVDSRFDVTTELPVRLFFADDGRTQSVVLVLHHIAADGASLVPLMDSLSRCYRARAAGAVPERRQDPGIPHGPSPATAEDLAWWRAQLTGLPEAIELPFDRPRPPVRDHRGDALRRELPAPLGDALRRTAAAHQATPFMVVQAVLAGLLSRCGAGDDIPLGTISSARATSAEESVVAFLANTLVTRTDTSGDPDFATLIDRVRSVTVSMLERAHVPFDRVVGELNPTRSPHHHPLFQVLLVAQNTDAARFDAGDGAPAVTLGVDGNGTAKFDLTCEVFFDDQEGSAGLHLRWEYASDVWDREGVERLADAFERLLRQAVEDPSSRLWQRPLDPAAVGQAQAEAERMLAFRRSGRRCAAIPVAETLAEALEAALRRTPEATALIDVHPDGSRDRVAYAELEQRSGRIRDALRRAGIGPGDLVALLVPRSALQVEAIAGVVRSGAAYLPLDGDYPAERLAGTIEDARPAVLLHQGVAPAEVLKAMGAAQAIDLDALRHTPAPASVRPLGPVRPEDPAYVIFTSGSTGRPKGVVIPQSHVLRLLDSTDHWFGFGPDDVWTLFHSYAFDFAVWEMFGALLTGGSLVVVPTTISRSPAEFLAMLHDERVTVLNQTPSAFGQLVRADALARDDRALPLRTIVLGGEAMDPATVRTWFSRHAPGDPDVVNMYGITETCVHVTYQRLGEGVDGRSPVGEPIPDLSVYLLDAGGHPVPDGVVGEIHVGGAGVAAGYLGRADLTAQRFVTDPFAANALRRRGSAGSPLMYRSGDLAVRTRQGVLDFRGRADRQVQLRGFRIELGEVEAAALGVHGVTAAHVRVVRHAGDDERLVVDLVGPDPATADPVALRRDIAAALPAQMAPSAVTVLAEFPLTVNGKLDESALPAPSLPRSRGREARTANERLVCEVFAEVLGLDECSAEDSFFDLGGHSLLAVGLVSRLRDRTGRELRVGTLLGAQTPALLAAHLDGGTEAAADADLRVLLPLREGDDALFCIHPAGGLSWCYAGLPRHLPSGLAVYGLQARGVQEPGSQPGSLSDMADDYIAELLRVRPRGPYHLLGWSLGGMVAHVMAARMQQRGLDVGLVVLLDAYPSEAESGVEEPPLADAISAVLAMAGLDDADLENAPAGLAALGAILAAHDSPMAGLPQDVLAALVRTYRNTTRILREYRHEEYTGDVLFFRAARAGVGPDHEAEEWSPHVRGALRIVDVDCTHREMTQPGPLRLIGETIAAALSVHDSAR